MVERINANWFFNQVHQTFDNLHQIFREEGLGEVVSTWEQMKGENGVYKLLDWLDCKFYGTYPILKSLAQMEEEIPASGLVEASRRFLNKIGVEVKEESKRRWWMHQEGTGVLAFGNHESTFEHFAFTSLLGREDINFVGVKIMTYLGPHSRPYFLPVMPGRYATDRKVSGLKSRFDPAHMLYRAEGLSSREIHQLNDRSLKQAAEKLAAGEIVFICPAGGFKITNKWGSGIGRIILNTLELPNLDLDKILLVSCCFSGISKREVYEAARASQKNGSFSKTLKVRFGTEFNLAQLVNELTEELGNEMTATQITEFLRQKTLEDS